MQGTRRNLRIGGDGMTSLAVGCGVELTRDRVMEGSIAKRHVYLDSNNKARTNNVISRHETWHDLFFLFGAFV